MKARKNPGIELEPELDAMTITNREGWLERALELEKKSLSLSRSYGTKGSNASAEKRDHDEREWAPP